MGDLTGGKFRQHSPPPPPPPLPPLYFPLTNLGPAPPGGTGAGAGAGATYFMTFLKANVFQRSNKVSCPAPARGKYKYLGAVIRLFLGIWKNSFLRGGKNINLPVLSK